MTHADGLGMSAFPQLGTGVGLSRRHFAKTCQNGFGDGYNSYAHSIAWFKDHLFVGTSRATMALIKAGAGGGMKDLRLDVWPVEISHPVYSREFELQQARAEIWRYKPETGAWTWVHQAPMVHGTDGTYMSRELGYRAMAVFQGESDPTPALYVATWSRSVGEGMRFLRSLDGEHFEAVGPPGIIGLPVTSTRSLVPFKGRLFTSPTGAPAGRQNASGYALVLETRDPANGNWVVCNENGFGDPANLGIFEMIATDEYLYAGTGNVAKGYQLWRTRAEGNPPYVWEQVLRDGAGRGRLNQGVVSLAAFGDAIFVGSGIQKGGIDRENKVGPAGAELVRVNPDGSHDIIMGERRTPDGPLSGLLPGWNNFFCGSIWKMAVHDGWLYAGTQDWSVFLLYKDPATVNAAAGQLLTEMTIENVVEFNGGFDLWRSRDGENWIPVSRDGFSNPYNHGVRTLLSTPRGFFVGTSNQFGPRSAFRCENGGWEYRDNPGGGAEVWCGRL
jgi:hypothetical protein